MHLSPRATKTVPKYMKPYIPYKRLLRSYSQLAVSTHAIVIQPPCWKGWYIVHVFVPTFASPRFMLAPRKTPWWPIIRFRSREIMDC